MTVESAAAEAATAGAAWTSANGTVSVALPAAAGTAAAAWTSAYCLEKKQAGSAKLSQYHCDNVKVPDKKDNDP